ncbi:MAG: polymerase sigma54 factor [Deltaproteobacteria bacterium]|jgi:RNA polymerase sigma-54 factor|nr:polymerase sigma54 factor [Deltaproteobacteria bacterium]
MLELKQTQKLAQQLVLTPQLQQAIRLLQLSQMELLEAIELEIKENPVLEIEEEAAEQKEIQKKEEVTEWLERFSPSEDYVGREEKDFLDYENMVRKTNDLRDYLRWQVGVSDFSRDERVWAEWIIENIDDNGYLASPLEEISGASGIPADHLEGVLKKVQKLDPSGVGARDLKECVLIQYEDRGEKDPAFEAVVSSYFELFRKMDLRDIAKKAGYPVEKIREIFEMIKSFDPKPGRNYEGDQTIYVVPDVHVVKTEDGFEVFLNDEGMPELKMSRYYMNLYTDEKLNGDAREYIKKKIKQAEWFMKSLEQRQKTLYLVSKSIVDFQQEFFEKGVRCLKPLILKDVAHYIGVHESTVSRITTNKYMGTPFGVYEMKFFFTTGVGSEFGDAVSTNAVMDLITEIISKEDKKDPLKDEEIVALLKTQHTITIARRTVAKYREVLHIQSSRERRRLD